MSDIKIARDVLANAQLCAERGWKATFNMQSGEKIEKAYITGTNWDVGVVSIEKVGERHLQPTLVELKDVASVEVGWA